MRSISGQLHQRLSSPRRAVSFQSIKVGKKLEYDSILTTDAELDHGPVRLHGLDWPSPTQERNYLFRGHFLLAFVGRQTVYPSEIESRDDRALSFDVTLCPEKSPIN